MRKIWLLLVIVIFSLSFSKVGKSMESRSSTSQGVLISVTNKSDRPISAIKMLYTGGAHTIPIMKASETYQFYANPTSESHIELEFEEEQKRKVKISINTYFEPDYAGSLFIFIDKGGKVTWEDNIVIRQKYK